MKARMRPAPRITVRQFSCLRSIPASFFVDRSI
jgi:hypothetical protein